MSGPWTPERRLRLLAQLLARRRDEAIGKVPRSTVSTLNNESFLAIAAGPAAVLDSPGLSATLDDLTGMYATREPEDLWREVEHDIRQMFPPSGWPSWLPREEPR